uniref:Transcription repressor n=1 Tax=Brassica campestris TaxID=3711 RepID=M4CWA3_BRACM
MPNPVQQSVYGYLSKIKREAGKLQSSSSKSLSSSKKWVLSYKLHKKLSSLTNVRRPSKTSRFNDNHPQDPGQAATLSDIDRFLEENFKSLCIRDGGEEGEEDHRRRMSKKKEKRDQSSDDSSDTDEDDYYRHRFQRTWEPAVYDSPKLPDPRRRTGRLSPPPGSSEGTPSMYTTPEEERRSLRSHSSSLVLPENCIAVLRCTEEPQEDFRRSMVEMMESKLGGGEVDWDLMEELLFCYLDLNHKKSHKFILSAFVDLIISLRVKEKRVTRKSLEMSLSTRAARDRFSKRSYASRN